MHILSNFLLSISVSLAAMTAATGDLARPQGLNAGSADTFVNPIIDNLHADPWILEWNGAYYFVSSPSGKVTIYKSSNFAHFDDAAGVVVWQAEWSDCWAPEIHRIDGEFYIYCATQDGDEDADRRSHVLKGTDSNDPMQPFEDLGVITTPDLNYAIDGTILEHQGSNYFIWSGKESRDTGTVQYLYIAKMLNATTLIGERSVIHSPYWPDGSRIAWQWSPSNTAYGVNEGPTVLKNGNQTFVVYSASGSWDTTYCLAIMGLKSPDADPLLWDSWWRKEDAPVFKGNNVTVGTGHASYIADRAGTNYIIYHAWPVDAPAGWGSRRSYAQPFKFGQDGLPEFPAPVAQGVPVPAPVGYE